VEEKRGKVRKWTDVPLQSDFPDDQLQIHWALSYPKSRHAAAFAEHVVRQKTKSRVIILTDSHWNSQKPLARRMRQ
jgi:hypothetical protein